MGEELIKVLRRHERRLLAIEGVVGVGISGGKIMVYVEGGEVGARVPASIEGVPTEVRVTGKIRKLTSQ
jgi:hypothetical protein